jgi:hypothetical protein
VVTASKGEQVAHINKRRMTVDNMSEYIGVLTWVNIIGLHEIGLSYGVANNA